MSNRFKRVLSPGSRAWRERVETLFSAEAEQPRSWWWLSFADPDLPKGQQFLGVAIVEAPGFSTAVDTAHRLGINPGGEVQSLELPAEQMGDVPEQMRHRLLSLAELVEAGLVE